MNRGHAVRRLIAVLATVGAATGSLVGSLPAGASSADARAHATSASPATRATQLAGPTNLGVTSFGRILVDPATAHVFVSSPGSSEIFVLDYNGTVVKTITGEAGAWGMGPRGTTPYVGLTPAGPGEKHAPGPATGQ